MPGIKTAFAVAGGVTVGLVAFGGAGPALLSSTGVALGKASALAL